jgi:hypothetical protein
LSIEITHVRYGGSQKTHESITHYKWRGRENGEVSSSDKVTLVAWVDNKGIAYVGSGAQQVRVGVVRPTGSAAYLRTYADKEWSNNLLSLPTF